MSASTVPFNIPSTFEGPTLGESMPRSPWHEGTSELCFARTSSGEVELHSGAVQLRSSARELLKGMDRGICVGPSEASDDKLTDAMQLLDLGLIKIVSFDATTVYRTGAKRVSLQALAEALLALSSDGLYTLLTQQAKRRLGLLQGFRMVLALERCASQNEHHALAIRFIQESWRMHGVTGVRPLQKLLRVG